MTFHFTPNAFALLVFTACLRTVSGADSSLDGIGEVRLKGAVGERLDAMIERSVLRTDVDYLTEPFLSKTETRGGWQTEFWGKYMHSAVPYAAYTRSPELEASIVRGVKRILGSQEESGYIGNYPDALRCGEGWDVWGMKYTMMGLLHYADGERGKEPGERALRACRRLCDYVIAELGPDGRRKRAVWQTGNWSGMASSSILEPVMWLYRRTKDRRYLDFATYLVEGMEKPEAGPRLVDLALKGVSVADRNGHGNAPDAGGGYVMKQNRWKAYEMMSCYQGLLEYWAVKSEGGKVKDEAVDRLFRAAILSAEDIVREEVNLAGGCASSEAWFHGAGKQHLGYQHLQETCVTTTWMRFCEKLLDLTDDPKWADQIERSFYNAYLAAIRPDGAAFAGYTPLTGSRCRGQHQCSMQTDCCAANGPRGFLCFLRPFVRRAGDCVTFNFYGTAQLPGFDMYSLYPRKGSVRIVSRRGGTFRVRFRIPGWCAKSGLKVNGEPVDAVRSGGYLVLSRTWAPGDIAELNLDMPVVAHRNGHYTAFTCGPVLLARDSRFGDGPLSENLRDEIRDGQVMTTFVPVRSPSDGIWMAYSATLPLGSHWENPEDAHWTTVQFCDFASAGGDWCRTSHYRTWFEDERHPMEDLTP